MTTNYTQSHSLQKAPVQDKNKYIFFNSLIKLDPEPSADQLTLSIMSDSFYRLFFKKNLISSIVWGYNSFAPSTENLAKARIQDYKDQLLMDRSESEFDSESELANINHEALKICWKQQQYWYGVNKSLGLFQASHNAINTISRRTVEKIWTELANLWGQEVIQKDYTLTYYNPKTKISFNPDADKSNIVIKKRKAVTQIVKCKMTETSRKKLILKLQSEVELQIEEQEELKDELIERLLEIKDLGVISKKSKIDILTRYTQNQFDDGYELNSDGDTIEVDLIDKNKEKENKSNRFKAINWENFKTTEEFEQEIIELKQKLDTIQENLDILFKLKETVASKQSMYLLSWLDLPFTVLTVVALGLNPVEEYALFYLENTREFVIIAEKRAIAVLNLQIDSRTVNSESIEDQLEEGMDSGDYFSKIGEKIYKLASFSGADLEGVEYEPIMDTSWWNLTWSQKSNCHKVYTNNEISVTSGTGIKIISPWYGLEDYAIARTRNLPLLQSLDESGCVKLPGHLPRDLQLLNGQSYQEAGFLINGILEKKRSIFATFTSMVDTPIYNYDAVHGADDNFKSSQLYTQIEKNYTVSQSYIDKKLESLNIEFDSYAGTKLYNPISISNKNQQWGVPFPLWQNSEGDQIFIKSISQVALKSINPIYILLNHRNLDPKLYSAGQVLILTDKFTKLPLGINAVQFRSGVLTELRKDKDVTMANFEKYFDKILEEIYGLFDKYPTIQIMLDNQEQLFMTACLNSTNLNYTEYEKVFYFYQSVQEADVSSNRLFQYSKSELILNKFIAKGSIKLLKTSRACLDEMIIMDDLNSLYKRIPDVINMNIINGFISKIYNNSISEEGTRYQHLYYLWSTTEYSQWFLPSLIFGYNNPTTRHFVLKSQAGLKLPQSVTNNIAPDIIREYTLNQEFLFLKTSEVAQVNLGMFISEASESSAIDMYESLDSLQDKRTQKLQDLKELSDHIYQLVIRKDLLKANYNRAYYQHTLNQWWKIQTQIYVTNIISHISALKFSEALEMFWQYIDDIVERFGHYGAYLDGYQLGEVWHCLQYSITNMAGILWIILPETASALLGFIRLDSKAETLGYEELPSYPELTPFDNEINNQFEWLENMIAQTQKIRQNAKILIRQSLYADFSQCELDKYLLEVLAKVTNLVGHDLSKLEGSTTVIGNQTGQIKIDLVIYDELSSLGLSKEFEKVVNEFIRINYDRNRLNQNMGEPIALSLQIIETPNQDLVMSVIKNINWNKLNLEIRWASDLGFGNAKRLVVKDLASFWVG